MFTYTASTGSSTNSNFTVIPEDETVEEEDVPGYKPELFCPVHIGDVFHSRYKVIGKLGFGTGSTVWLCKDNHTTAFVVVKVCTIGQAATNELSISHHLRSIKAEHPGQERIRVALDDFTIEGPSGSHQCLVFAPQGVTYTEYRNMLPGHVLPESLLQQSLLMVLLGLDFLHQAGIVHTDISPNNILLGVTDTEIFSDIEQSERQQPSPRKSLDDRAIYVSYKMPATNGAPLISDFGSARLGDPDQRYSGDVMPTVYRAPEVILGMEWDSKIDVWSVAVMTWDLFEGGRLFRSVRHDSNDDERHLAEMVSLMGPPPEAFLERSPKCRKYWDSKGNWIGTVPILDQTLETRETRLEGKDKELFVQFARKILRWLPEERPSAEDLFEDKFLNLFRNLDTSENQ